MAQVTVSFSEKSLEAGRIKDVFELEGKALAERMQALAEAALEEYMLEMSGVKSISTIREQRELRLYLLYKHLGPLGGLSDWQVGELFQMTRTQVATLIAGTWARYRPELEEGVNAEVAKALDGGDWDDDQKNLQVELRDSLARYIRDAIDQTTAPPMEKLKEVAGTYELTAETVRELRKQLGI